MWTWIRSFKMPVEFEYSNERRLVSPGNEDNTGDTAVPVVWNSAYDYLGK